jgi:Flp pilus assembly protein TadG
MKMCGPRPRRGWEEGATAVEAAIVFSILFALVFGIVEFGMTLWQWNTMELAVLQAGRYAMVNNGNITPAIAENKMQAALPGASISCPLPANPAAGAWYVCATRTAGAPNTMSLAAIYGYNVIGLAGPFKVTAQATVPLD